ncbi:hypothetical protein DFH09DRAFT_1140380 [Mycena vulgaris]|nr:hypothetical protein DFH09DRAFT_1140380 [Mycena vulgaris]
MISSIRVATVLVALFILPALGASGTSSVHTDAHAVTCQSFSISWVGGTAPFKLTLQDAAAPEPPLESVTQTDSSFVWIPNVPAGTTVALQISDSGGTLAQTSSFNVQKGTDTSCVIQPKPSFVANISSPANEPSSTGSSTSTTATLSISASPSESSRSAISVPPTAPSPSISNLGSITNPTSEASGGRKVAAVAIVAPIVSVLVLLVMLFLLLRLRQKRRRANPTSHDPESMASQSLSVQIGPSTANFGTPVTSPDLLYPSEKSLPAVPIQPQVSAQELQVALDRIQEMYAIMQQTQVSSATAGEVSELQRQIQELVADNAALIGEPPPDYDSNRLE